MTAPSEPVTHGSFRIEREYRAAPSRVFAAFADPVTKRRWFAGGEGWDIDTFEVDFRVHGRERSRLRRAGSDVVVETETFYLDIVPQRRITFAYGMTVAGAAISASLATVEITPSGAGTALAFTEQGAFFGETDQLASREAGCRKLFERLEDELRAE